MFINIEGETQPKLLKRKKGKDSTFWDILGLTLKLYKILRDKYVLQCA